MTFRIPKTVASAKIVCKKLCDEHGVKIYFDDEFGNFGSSWNQSSFGGSIECSRFNDWNGDLLLFAVMHELGHRHYGGIKKFGRMNGFVREFMCWKYAIKLYMETFGVNISIKQARYMMDCLNSYIPDYNKKRANDYNCMSSDYINQIESTFWCPISKKVRR